MLIIKSIKVGEIMGSASLKVAGGKLIKARVEALDGIIESIRLTGDFFLHPEDVLFEIESSLLGRKLDETEISSVIVQILSNSGAQLIGATPLDFTKVIMEASK